MNGLRTSRPQWLTALMMLALFMRLAVPSGWMPNVSDGHLRIEMCSGMAPVEVILDKGSTHKPTSDQSEKSTAPCAFGGAFSAGGIAPQLPSFTLGNVRQATLFLGFALANLNTLGLFAPPPPSHGPPAA